MSMPLLAAFGSAIADCVCRVSHRELSEVLPGVVPGSVLLTTAEEQRRILDTLGRSARRMPGGSAANTLRAAAASGMSAGFITAVGKDDNGNFIRSAMEDSGVDCSACIVIDGAVTDCVLNLVTPDGERTMLPMIDAGRRITAAQIETVMPENAVHLHFEGYSLRNPEVTCALAEYASEKALPVSLDLAAVSLIEEHGRELQGFLRINMPKWLFFNRSEGVAFTGCHEAKEAAVAALEYAHGVVATDGAAGAWCAIRGQTPQVIHFPATPPEKMVDTIGAGDTWNGTFLANLLSGRTIEEAGTAAAAAAARVIAREGADLRTLRDKNDKDR